MDSLKDSYGLESRGEFVGVLRRIPSGSDHFLLFVVAIYGGGGFTGASELTRASHMSCTLVPGTLNEKARAAAGGKGDGQHPQPAAKQAPGDAGE